MGFSSFQIGFQAGFQVKYPATKIPAYNGNSTKRYREYTPTSHELRNIERLNEIERLKVKKEIADQELKAKEYQIEELELERLKEGLADQQLQFELMQLFAQQRDILLRTLELERLIKELQDEDEAIMVLLLCSPF